MRLLALLAALMGLLNSGVQRGHAQTVDRAEVELLMRELMPRFVRCERVFWGETISYCRYETPDTPSVVFEISFGADGPAGSLTYNIGSGGRQFIDTMRRFFSQTGVQEKALDECIKRSRSKASSVLLGETAIKCRLVSFADSVAYEISTERLQ
jgi:hypothetical protein